METKVMTDQTKSIGFADAIRICVKEKYAHFEGRATRSEYWYFYLFVLITSVICQTAATVMSFVSEDAAMKIWSLYIIFGLAIFLPQLGVTIRRLHDTGKSGRYLLIVLIPIAGIFIFIAQLIKPSSPEDNKYGPAPKKKCTKKTTGTAQKIGKKRQSD